MRIGPKYSKIIIFKIINVCVYFSLIHTFSLFIKIIFAAINYGKIKSKIFLCPFAASGFYKYIFISCDISYMQHLSALTTGSRE